LAFHSKLPLPGGFTLKVKRSRRRPSAKVTADGRGVGSHAGTRLLADMADRAGLGADLTAALAPTVHRGRRHDPGDVLVDLAVTLADGGECVSDLKVLRDQPGLFGQVASQPTAWRVLDSIDENLLAELQSARAASRARVWAAGGWPEKLTLDFDASLVNVHSEKEKAAPTYKRGFGYHPLMVYLDETSEALASKLRLGSDGANTAADHIELLDAAIAQLPVVTKADDPETEANVLVRAGTAGATHSFVDAIVTRHFEFSIGFDITEAVRLAILEVSERAWQTPMTQDMEDRDGAGWWRSPRTWTSPPGRPEPGRSAGEKSPCGRPVQPVRPRRLAPPGIHNQLHRPRHHLPRGPPPRPRPSRRPHQRSQRPGCCASPQPTSPPTPPGCSSSA